ncbi:MAG TPA: beta-galactosidase [Cyclobacteriaceae bacterium]|nr:beta-galactosidase [Cyclobacteriaceae bacterium]HMV07931.1 beta-galactosidase [Cyclobacteriaceae bacterium]HMV88199.1 beta-galactosidase [Cyclobacteriaceae bacterium]HMW99065.1 beta-galactosidase [Cyclobacteriaceae bacterium]HMX48302.1 beta-galactosidase [Cyclobacteriaceae bacterium]
MKRILILLLVALSCCTSQKHTFQIAEGEFRYDNKPIKIYSGEMHYGRIPREYWQHRLQMAKAMGLNAVCTYVFWNYHETAPGTWDFKSGNRDLAAFIKAAQKEGLLVILRPGPYACAEWEFGGYPWWLQNNKDLVIRANNKPFLDSCRVYINRLADQVRDLQVTKGGPVIMVQAENEFGSYVAQRKDIPLDEHKKYSAAIHSMLLEAGIEVPLFTSDGSWLFEGGSIKGALPTANGEDNIDKLKEVVNQYNNNHGPYMVAEFYPGWLDHWTEPFVKVSADQVVQQTEKYVKNGVSFNFYMVHGGTNFGFTSGANYTKEFDIQPDITSYDYDAPISEAGWATEKYKAVRDLLKKYVQYEVPEIPAPIPVIAPSINLTTSANFFDIKKTVQPVVSDSVLTFEQLNQGHGYVLYSRTFGKGVSGKLRVPGLRDYATVYVNDKRVGVLNRINKLYELDIEIPANGRLDLLVENMGRINYGANIVFNTKGIISPVLINGETITGSWQMYKLPMEHQPAVKGATAVPYVPVFYSGQFNISETGDVFFDMRGWGKGIVFVNGHHIGRYWSVGPQQTLYVPGCWLKKGHNEVVIFEQLNDTPQTVLKTVAQPILDSLSK